jgi:clan AA aspartic protease
LIEGFANNNLEPIVDIELLDENGNREKTSVIIDTGFNGYLCLSEDLVEKVKLSYYGSDRFELGDGKVVESDVYLGMIAFDDKEVEVLVILSASEDTLIGTSLLKDKTLFVNFVDRKLVIQAVP